MIDTYFDRADAAAGIAPIYRPADFNNPLRYRGLYFDSLLSRDIFAAKDRMSQALNEEHAQHIAEMRHGVALGSDRSYFDKQGRRK